MQITFWSKARYWVLLLLVVLITVSSHPFIVEMSHDAGMESGTILSRYIVLVFGALFVMCINIKSMLTTKEVRTCWFIYLWIALFFLLTWTFFGNREMIKDLRYIAFCLISIMIGWQLNMQGKQFRIVLVVFAGMILFVGLMQVFVNIGGFVILDQYQSDNKNSLGVMLATSAIIFLFFGMNWSKKSVWKLCFIGLVIAVLVVLLTIRARTATLAVIILLLYVFYERFKGKNFVFYLVFGLFLLFVVFLFLPQSIKDYVYNSFFQHYEGGDITSGRAYTYRLALNFLSEHIFFGNLDQNYTIAWIHNYPLNRTFAFGVVFVIPILCLYLYLLINAIKNTIKSNNHDIYNVGYYLLLVPFIVSMAEPTFPFGPGTATVFNFLIFGASLRNTYNEKTNTDFLMEEIP